MRLNNALVGTRCVFNGVVVIKRFQGIGHIFTAMVDGRFRVQLLLDTVDLKFREGWRCVLFIYENISVHRMIDCYQFDFIKIGGFP